MQVWYLEISTKRIESAWDRGRREMRQRQREKCQMMLLSTMNTEELLTLVFFLIDFFGV